MRIRLPSLLLLFSCALAWAAPPADLPQRDLRLELRQIEDPGEDGAMVLRTNGSEPLLLAQSVRVRNGATAQLRMNTALPMQWVQKIEAQPQSSASAALTGTGITQAITWMDAGQALQVTPRWPGGQRAVQLEVQVQSAAVGERYGAELPAQTRSFISTVVQAPLGEWVTLAGSGTASTPGSYSSQSAANTPKLVQIRVTLN